MGVSPKPSTQERRGGPFHSAPPQGLALKATPICRVQQGPQTQGWPGWGAPGLRRYPSAGPAGALWRRATALPLDRSTEAPVSPPFSRAWSSRGWGVAPAAPAPSPAVRHTLGLLRDLRPGPRPRPCSRWGSARCPSHSLGATAAPKATSLFFHTEPQTPWPPAA